jgi:hypothetical protein
MEMRQTEVRGRDEIDRWDGMGWDGMRDGVRDGMR